MLQQVVVPALRHDPACIHYHHVSTRVNHQAGASRARQRARLPRRCSLSATAPAEQDLADAFVEYVVNMRVQCTQRVVEQHNLGARYHRTGE